MTRTELLAVAKPILFNTEMVRAILDGRKTCTRRLVKFLNKRNPNWSGYVKDGLILYNGNNQPCNKSSPYKPDDILYVRETWCEYDADHVIDGQKYAYRADATLASEEARRELGYKWKPSIHMPKEAARIFLRVTDVRVERLQDCGNMQAKDEGLNCCAQFIRVWNTTVKKSDLELYGWQANPWVWVIEFEKVEVKKNG